MQLLYLWPWPLTFQPKTILLVGYPKVIPYTKFKYFGIFHFWVMLRTNRQTQTCYPRWLTESARAVNSTLMLIMLYTTPIQQTVPITREIHIEMHKQKKIYNLTDIFIATKPKIQVNCHPKLEFLPKVCQNQEVRKRCKLQLLSS